MGKTELHSLQVREDIMAFFRECHKEVCARSVGAPVKETIRRLRWQLETRICKGWPKGKVFGVALIFLLMIGIYGAWQYLQSTNGNKQKAPLFTLTDIDGNTISLEALRGRIVVLDFFYIRCGYCDDEFLELEKIYQTYTNDDVAIISISIDPYYDTIDRLREFKTGPNQYSNLNYEMSWILTRDTSGVSEDYGISAAPTIVIIDKEGFTSPRSPYVGVTDFSTLSDEISALINR